MSRKIWSWVIALATALAMTVSLLGVGAPAFADSFNPPAPTTNDPVGTTQDWFVLADDPNGFYSWFYDEAGMQGVPTNERVYVGGASSITVYARHYQGMVRSFPMTFTNAAGTVAANTVSMIPISPCNPEFGTTQYRAVFNDTYDGTGLASTQPIIQIVGDVGSEHNGDPSFSGEVVDGTSLDMSSYTLSGGVWLGPGWFTVTPYSYNSHTGLRSAGPSVRVWVESCSKYFPVPEGQVPPGTTGNPENPHSALPGRGTVRVVSCQQAIIKVIMNNKKRELKAQYRLFIDRPGPGKKSTKRFVVKPNFKPKPKRFDLQPRTRVVLKVQKPGTNEWKKLKGVQTGSCLSAR